MEGFSRDEGNSVGRAERKEVSAYALMRAAEGERTSKNPTQSDETPDLQPDFSLVLLSDLPLSLLAPDGDFRSARASSLLDPASVASRLLILSLDEGDDGGKHARPEVSRLENRHGDVGREKRKVAGEVERLVGRGVRRWRPGEGGVEGGARGGGRARRVEEGRNEVGAENIALLVLEEVGEGCWEEGGEKGEEERVGLERKGGEAGGEEEGGEVMELQRPRE